MRGAPMKAIQELARPQNPTTAQRSLHLSPKAKESVLKLLEGVRFDRTSGDIMETAQGSEMNP